MWRFFERYMIVNSRGCRCTSIPRDICESSDSILRARVLWIFANLPWLVHVRACVSPNAAIVVRQAGACLRRRQSERQTARRKLEIAVSYSLSCRVVTPCTVNTNHTIRKHTRTEREKDARLEKGASARTRLPHFSTHKDAQIFLVSKIFPLSFSLSLYFLVL